MLPLDQLIKGTLTSTMAIGFSGLMRLSGLKIVGRLVFCFFFQKNLAVLLHTSTQAQPVLKLKLFVESFIRLSTYPPKCTLVCSQTLDHIAHWRSLVQLLAIEWKRRVEVDLVHQMRGYGTYHIL